MRLGWTGTGVGEYESMSGAEGRVGVLARYGEEK